MDEDTSRRCAMIPPSPLSQWTASVSDRFWRGYAGLAHLSGETGLEEMNTPRRQSRSDDIGTDHDIAGIEPSDCSTRGGPIT